MKTGFVFTNYNNSHYTQNLVSSIYRNTGHEAVHIAIVDNSSEQSDREALQKLIEEFPEIKVIFNNVNVGYFKGLNIGIKYLRDNISDLDHIVVGNNDLVFPDDFLHIMGSIPDVLAKYAVISPDLITLDGVHQNPHVIEKTSRFREVIYDVYYSNYYLSAAITCIARLTKRFTDRRDEDQFEIAQSIYQGYGACYVLSKLFFSHFESLWAPTFLMGEEYFLSKQLNDRGLKVYYEPRLIVNHHDHATMAKLPTRKLWEISRASHLVYRKYHKIFK